MTDEPDFSMDGMHAAVVADQQRALDDVGLLTAAPEALRVFRRVGWEARREAFGASEIGALLDASPWESRADVVRRKASGEELPRKPAMLLGACLESGILAYYVALTHHEATAWETRGTIASDAFPRLVVTPDAHEPDAGTGPTLLEIKHSAGGRGWGTGHVVEEYDGVTVHEGRAAPLHVQIQVQGQLAVTGYPRARIVGLIRGKLRVYECERHDGVIARIAAECVSAWRDVEVLRAHTGLAMEKRT